MLLLDKEIHQFAMEIDCGKCHRIQGGLSINFTWTVFQVEA